MARVLVGVTGGIAAYKACELVRMLVKGGHEVVPLVTPGADRFVRAETFFALARRSPAEDLYAHLTRADLLVIAPLTANTLAKLAHGLADDLVAEAALAHRGPVLLAPAMNPRMWANAATQANLETVRSRGAEIVGPDEGETAEGEWGLGRMAEPEEIYRRCRKLLGETDSLAGRRVLVSAGGTREPLDAVRFLGNRSSGRMGVALAEEARKRGAEVTLLAANLGVPAPPGVEVVEAPTAQAMLEQALARSDADLVLMAAAVADYRPADVSGDKRPWIAGLIVPDPEWALEWSRAQGEKFDFHELQDLPAFKAAIRAAVDRVNKDLSVVEKVRQFAFADEAFSIDNKEMTPSLKIRRHKIRERYGARIGLQLGNEVGGRLDLRTCRDDDDLIFAGKSRDRCGLR